jgi:ribosomal protein S4
MDTPKQRGRPCIYENAEDYMTHRREYVHSYNQTEGAKEARRKYQRKRTLEKQVERMYGNICENQALLADLLKKVIENEELLNVLWGVLNPIISV